VNSIVLPVLLPMLAAAVALMLRGSPGAQRIAAGLGAHATLAAALAQLLAVAGGGTRTLRIGGFPDTFGIVFVADLFAALMLAAASATHVCAWWFLVAGSVKADHERAFFHPLFLLIAAGVNWAFSTGDLFNLFVSFEIFLIASYALLVHGNTAGQVREGSKFLVLNLVGSTVFLAAAALCYGVFGSLNLADLAIRIRETEHRGAALAIGTLLLGVFAGKAAAFPLFFWLPDAYPKAPGAALAYFGGVLSKVGVYCLYRTITLLFAAEAQWFQPLLLGIAAFSMTVGVLGAFSRWTMRHILGFHIVSQIGYMIFGLAMMDGKSYAAGAFFTVHQMPVKAALFLCAACMIALEGSDHVKKVHGAAARHPALAACFLLAALSLAGIPPLSGFFGKFGLVLEGFRTGHAWVTAASIATSLVTMYSMMKIWTNIFWGEAATATDAPSPHGRTLVAATAAMVAVTLLVAVFAGPIMALCGRAGAELANPSAYVESVLGPRGAAALAEASR
jgi:multicomponent Na+:H+ antiporter subunit D